MKLTLINRPSFPRRRESKSVEYETLYVRLHVANVGQHLDSRLRGNDGVSANNGVSGNDRVCSNGGVSGNDRACSNDGIRVNHL